MHAENRYACVHGCDVAVCHVSSHSTAATLVHLAQSCDLPDNACIIKGLADVTHDFGRSIGCAALAAGTGILADGDTVVQLRVVSALGNLGEVGIQSVGNVSGQAEGVCKAVFQLHALCVAQTAHEVLEVSTLHAGNAHGTDLFLVSQDADSGLGGGRNGEQSFQFCVCADTVIMAVSAEQASVQTYFTALAGGDNAQLGRQEITFSDAVLLVQQLHDVQLYQVAAFAFQRLGAQDHIQLLAGDDLCSGLLHLVACQMDQQVGDHKNGILGIFADGDGDGGAVLAADNAVQSQLHGGPLVLLDAAVVMSLEVSDLRILVQGIGLQVHTGGVYVGSADVGAICQRLSADDSQSDGLITVIVVDFITGLGFHAGGEGLEAILLSLSDGPCGSFALGLALVHESHVALAVSIHLFTLLGGDTGVAVLVGGKQGSAQFFGSHMYLSFTVNLFLL